jgi:hypothetical protein
MRKYVFSILLIILVWGLDGSWHSVNQIGSVQFNCNQMERGDTEIIFSLDGFELESKHYSGREYHRISHPEGTHFLEAGMPDLPYFTTTIAIPVEGVVSLEYEVLASELLSDITIYPLEELALEHEERQDRFFINSEYYEYGNRFPEDSVILKGPAVMRDLRVVTLSFCPFIYNAASGELEIAGEIRARVQVEGTGGENTTRNRGTISRAYEPIYRSMVINYADFIGRPQYQQPTIIFVIKDMADALEALEYLTDWKRSKGFNVVVATTAETGTTNQSIKNYLQNAYDNWENPPDYVCFCGDANGSYSIPTWGYGDHAYAQLDGNDLLEDVIIGRLSFQSVNTFQLLISKILNYEKEPFMDDTNWYEQALLAGDTSISGPSMRFTCQSIKDLMMDFPGSFASDDNFTEIYSGSFPSLINSAINSGVSYMVYRGWLGMSGWSPGGQTNGFKLPFATLLTCGTGSWTSGTSDSEQFVQMGTISNPTGAIGCVGMATAGTHSCFNNALTMGIYGGIFLDNLYTMGAATTRGKYYLYETFPQDPGGYVESYHSWANLMGDPSLELWTRTPEEINVISTSNIPTGSGFLPVAVRNSANAPIEGAWVTLSNDSGSFFSTDFTPIHGEVLIDLSGSDAGEYNLVVTSHGFIPYLGNLVIGDSDQYVDIQSVLYDDSSSGNGDGILNPGETVTIIPALTNFGSQLVTDISVIPSLSHSYMNFTPTVLQFGDIAAGETAEPAAGIELTILPSALGGMQGLLQLQVSDGEGNTWENWHYLNIEGVYLYAVDYEVIGNEILEPGISSEIYITLENIGSLAATDITAELHCLNPRLIITDSLGTFSTIPPGGSANNSSNTFELTPSVTVIPGSQLQVEAHLSNPSGYFQIATFTILVGVVEVTDPLGPDEYGYWCYDDGDLGYDNCPTYEWIEIDPAHAGNGTIIPLNDGGDTGDSEIISLPDEFTFTFYGTQYTEITVCSNGWISPGAYEGANFMNHPLPGPEGPSPMIAVFWDDLNVNSGNVCYYYNDIDHFFVVSWSDCNNGDTGSNETFQVILYDPNYHTTMTEDSLIKMQYKDINNNNSGNYPSNHGQFCTIGLESEAAQYGINYTFNNTYPASCKTLENEMALLFSPPQYPEFGPYLEMVSYDYLAGDDEFIEAGESVSLSILIGNQGAEEATDIDIEISINDPWFTVTNGEAFINEIEALGTYELINAFSFEVSEEVPDNYPFVVIIHMTAEDDFWSSSISLTAHWTNAFLVDQDSIAVVLGINHETERILHLTNTSAQSVNYYLRLDDGEDNSRDISGSFVSCNTDMFYPGTEMTWQFTVFNNSIENEWVNNVWLTFPPGISVTGATHATGGSGGLMFWDGTTGDNVTVNWNGETANGWGVLHNSESAMWNVNVSIGENFASDIQIDWEIGGDGYGNEPHNVSGELEFSYPIQWISLNTSFGTLASGNSDEIIIYYDTNDLEIGDYHCTIKILSDSWFEKLVQTHLTVVTVEQNPDEISGVTQLLGNFPNPFNPSTRIKFVLAEQSHTKLIIYNIKGQIVRTLLNDTLSADDYSVTWNGRNDNGISVSSGIYYLQLNTPSQNMTRKILLLK